MLMQGTWEGGDGIMDNFRQMVCEMRHSADKMEGSDYSDSENRMTSSYHRIVSSYMISPYRRMISSYHPSSYDIASDRMYTVSSYGIERYFIEKRIKLEWITEIDVMNATIDQKS